MSRRNKYLEKPNLQQRFNYLLGRPLPPQYQEWVKKDLTGSGWAFRYSFRFLVPLIPFIILFLLLPTDSWYVRISIIIIPSIPYIFFMVVLSKTYRLALLRANNIDVDLINHKWENLLK